MKTYKLLVFFFILLIGVVALTRPQSVHGASYGANPIPWLTTTDGEWQGSWPVNDTYLYTYGLILQATSGTKTAKVEITLR